MQEQLRNAVRRYAKAHADAEGVASAPVPGLYMMCMDACRGKVHSTYRPLVCIVLQGAKQLLVGQQELLCRAGRSIIVSADVPVVGQVVEASFDKPYIALAVELDMALLAELSEQVPAHDGARHAPSTPQTFFLQDNDEAIIDCGIRLMRLIDRPDAVPVLHPGLMKELHFWLLAGPHGAVLRSMAAPESAPRRLDRAVAVLRTQFRERIPVERLAASAAMSLTAFHRRFKEQTSLTPGQYQKRLRLIEARRLMMYQGSSASAAAYDVGYESVPQFTREYRRLFGVPPGQDSREAGRARAAIGDAAPVA